MASLAVDINDRDVLQMIEEYLANRHLDISLMCLERESGIINGVFSDDGLFLRQLILDGQWDDTLDFLQPLEGIEGYDNKRCRYLIYKYKYLELLCLKHDPGPLQNHEFTLDEVVSCLTELETLCNDRKEYDNLCFLLTLQTITQDKNYRDWNPSSARINCFNELYPLVKKFVGLGRKPPPNSSSKNDRLVNLIAKGLLYEMCVELCTSRACGSADNVTINHPLGGTVCTDADLSLVSWLQKVPAGTFACPFEKKNLKLKLEKLEKPSLEAIWSEQILVPPIRPKQFPHTALPTRTRSSQIVSQSMMAMYDGLSSHLYNHGLAGSMSEPRSHRYTNNSPHHLSRSYASPSPKFLLSNSFRSDRRSNPMNRSMERLFSTPSRLGPQSSSPLALVKEKEGQVSGDILSPPDPYIRAPISNASDGSNTAVYARCNQFDQAPDKAVESHKANQSLIQENKTPKKDNLPINQQEPAANHNHDLKSVPDMASTPKTANHVAGNTVSANQKTPVSQQGIHKPGTDYAPSNYKNRVSSPQQHQSQPPPAHSTSNNRMSADVTASQDLYAQFQEQKRKIEQELKLLEERDAMWRQIQEEESGDVEDIKVPTLNLNQTDVGDPQITSASNHHPIKQENSDDITEEIELGHIDDDVSIKQFVAVETLEEQGPVRAVAFHPSGDCYAVGSNTKVLRVLQYPDVSKITTSYNSTTRRPKVLAKKVKHHAGSIYCVAWNEPGTVIATGSNDHTVKCVQWLSDQHVFGSEKELSLHDGTVRDISFLSDTQLLSAGAGDCTICLTDITSGSVVRRYKGHTGHVLSIYPHRESQRFITGGQDKKALMWDLRMSVPVQTYSANATLADSAFTSVCLDPSPRVLATGHDNSCCSLFDIRQGRLLQAWRPHTDEVRSARFNTDATYFLTGSYDTTVKLMDMQGDITQPLKTVQVAEHMDKVIQARWHPVLPSFVTSSADKTVTCWAIQIDP